MMKARIKKTVGQLKHWSWRLDFAASKIVLDSMVRAVVLYQKIPFAILTRTQATAEDKIFDMAKL